MMANKTILHLKYKVYSLVMLFALAWLTISLPFVYANLQAQNETVQKQYDQSPEEEDSNSPGNNTTEEKTSSVNTLSEYLHDTHVAEHPNCVIGKSYTSHSYDLYIAFHPELICPPPDAVAS